ncbi:aromatic ring-hydroxylating dioxygenase subunit alpha [Streptomyces solisilvae]|uniref:aromatic ring-hydroxylating oxygenase subunit alpha n=1 Tax=Streptomyces malaysiensis TaxID=92644 RepID=UPI0036781DFD
MTSDLTKKRVVSPLAQRRDEVAARMQRLLMEHVINKTTDRGDHPLRNLATSYTDPARFEAEKRKLFRKLPVLAGLTRDVPNPGDKMLFEDAGPPILIVRAKDSVIRAYLNMCPHRAAKVVEVCRPGSRMTCPFHSWTFDLDGKLIGMPGSVSFDGLAQAELGLVKVPVVEWHGLIFVVADPDAGPIDIASYLGSFAPELEMLDLAGAMPIKTTRVEARTNWKYAVDTYGESYHLTSLHPDTVGKAAVNDTMVYEQFAQHHRICYAPIGMVGDAKKPRDEWPKRPFSAAAYLLFPNTVIHVTAQGPGHTFFVYRIFPGQSVTESFTMLTTYRSADVADDEDIAPWVGMHDYQAQVIGTEDYRAASAAQTNLEYAPAGHSLVYGSNEISIQNFEQYINNLVGDTDTDVDGASTAAGLTTADS